LETMRTVTKKRDGGVWEDDSVEIFLQPPDDVVFHVIVNSSGVIYDARSDDKASRWNPDIKVAASITRRKGRSGYWSAELAIPWKPIGGRPKPGSLWRVNFTRTDTDRGELSTWSRIENGGFLQPGLFGRLFFRSPSEAELAWNEDFLKKLTQENEASGGEALFAIPLDGDQPVTIERVAVEDCRVLKAFVGEPVDGCVRSLNYSGSVSEYPGRYVGAGISYRYLNNDGLHITLADDEGFDAVVIQGGARTELHVGVPGIELPKDSEPVWRFPGKNEFEVALFAERVKARRVSFFKSARGTLANVTFYRITKGGRLPRFATWSPFPESTVLTPPKNRFAPESRFLAMKEFYGEDERLAFRLAEGGDGRPVALQAETAKHWMTPPFSGVRGLSAVGIDAKLDAAEFPTRLEVTIHDPVNPRRVLSSLALELKKSKRVQLVIDIPDQVLLKGSRIWLTLRSDRDVKLTDQAGGAPDIGFEFIQVEQATPGAAAWRKLLTRTLFGQLSEPRPWGNYRRGMSRQEFYSLNNYSGQCAEFFMTIDQCTELAPKDDLVRQYREWVYLRNLAELSPVDPPPSPPKGVPAWAWYSRMAWLEFRAMADWWMTERLVPTGEVGVSVQDDTDFYQQFADLPYFEKGGVAAKYVDACERLAELAQKENLRGGINRRTTDSLHAYEEGINHLALMARWHYGDPVYFERCMESARNMEKLTILTQDGRRHFRDRSRMGFEDTIKPREPGIDGSANPLMWHTAFQVADYNHNPRTLKILREWADTWLKFQKPGEYATAVEVSTGKVLSSHPVRPLSGGYRSQAVSFLWLYKMTGERKYIRPFMDFLDKGVRPYPFSTLMSDGLALGMMDDLNKAAFEKLSAIGEITTLGLTGDPAPFVKQIIGSPRGWNAAIDNLYDARRFPDMYTRAHQYTDRVFLGNLQARASESYLGGFCKRNKYNPVHAVSWEGFGTDYAALVMKNRKDGLKVAVFNFAEGPIEGTMRVWHVERGRYQVTIGSDADGNFKADGKAITTERELLRADGIGLKLGPRMVTIIELTQIQKLDPIHKRADLAIAAREVEIQGGILKSVAHNIGGSDADNVAIAIVDEKGRTLLKQSIGRLRGPVDLIPSRKEVTLKLPGDRRRGWKLVLDPGNTIPEIFEGNNEIALDALPAKDYSKSLGPRR
ncbi:MAG: carbohydrate-binding family 9-like protein, partial [Planctomycetota bacterium]|nr:carbohydrate-binding family 9-like protein [Planctomycetota bacterium]